MSLKSSSPIPVLLLKTRSQPHDTYEEYFTTLRVHPDTTSPSFSPLFVPVLEHQQNEETLQEMGRLLRTGELKQRYGGMIFTSQRAVEAWADTVLAVDEKGTSNNRAIEDGDCDVNEITGTKDVQSLQTATDTRTGDTFETDIITSTPFPLYVVGPATGRALDTLITTLESRKSSNRDLFSQPTNPNLQSPFLRLNPQIHGTETGSGATLAPFIQKHYNALHSEKWFTFHDAPRLPFIPLVGMGSENYSRRRLEPDDARLTKRPLLFLVGEQRRDIIPKTLMDSRLGDDAINVDEVEVYSTVVRRGFQTAFENHITQSTDNITATIIIIIVFSPQGSGDMLKGLGLIDENNQPTSSSLSRWEPTSTNQATKEPIPVIATIGPTTRDHLINTFGFVPDVCAKKPSPEGVGEGILLFLREKGLL